MNKPKEAQNAFRVVLTMTGFTVFITVFTVLTTLNFVPRVFTNDM